MKRKCPHCGSTNIRSIVYGYPSPELWEEEIKGKVKLGGCCISENQPNYYCDDCEKSFNKGFIDLLFVTKIEVFINNFGSVPEMFILEKINDKYLIRYSLDEYELDFKLWNKIISHLINYYCLLELDDEYYPKDRYVTDGISCTMTVYSNDKEIKNIYCSNEFPPMFNSMIKYLNNIRFKLFTIDK